MTAETLVDVKSNATPNLLTLEIHDKAELYSHYMPFISNGGIFIPTEESFQIGDSTGMLIRFVDRGKKLMLTGNVVWMSPQGNSSLAGTRGVGLQFSGEKKHLVKKAIDTYLGELSGKPSLVQVY